MSQSHRVACEKLVIKSGDLALKFFRQPSFIKRKTDHSFLSQADIQINDYLAKQIHRSFPTHEIYSEEDKSRFNAQKDTFIIDPIDGTTNFVHGIPVFGTQIALWQDGDLAAAALYDPISKIVVSADTTSAFINRAPVVLRPVPLPRSTLIFDTGRDKTIQAKFFQSDILKKCRSLRRFGSLITDVIFLTSFETGVYVGLSSNLYDFAPAACILKAAGYKVVDQTLKSWFPHQPNTCIAYPPSYSRQLKPLLSKIFLTTGGLHGH